MRAWFGVMALRVLLGLQILSARPCLIDGGPGAFRSVVPDRGGGSMGAASGAHSHMVVRSGMHARFGVLRGGSDAESGQEPPASDGGAGKGKPMTKKGKPMTKKERLLMQLSNTLPPRVLRTLDGLVEGWEMVNETAVRSVLPPVPVGLILAVRGRIHEVRQDRILQDVTK